MTPRTRGDTLAVLFRDGELWLAEDGDGWEGFVREIQDGEPAYFYVDTRPSTPPLRNRVRVAEQAVRETVHDHLEPDREPMLADGRGS